MAARYFINGDGTGLWGNTANWSATSGGAGGASVPTSADDVFLNAASPNCILNAFGRSALSLTCTGYPGTLTLDQTLTISGSLILGAGMTVAPGAGGAIQLNAPGTLTSNGVVIPRLIFNNSTGAITLTDNVTASLKLTLGTGTNTYTINGFTLYCTGDLQHGSAGAIQVIIAGTTNLVLNGTGTIFSLATANGVRLPTTINTTGTVTIGGVGGNYRVGGNFTYVAGTVAFTGALICSDSGGAPNLSLPGMTLGDLQFSNTATLSTDLISTGVVTLNGSTLNGSRLTINGGMLRHTLSSVSQGTTEFVLGNGSTWEPTGTGANSFRNPLTLNAPSGTITLNGLLPYQTGPLTYTAGTVVFGSGFLLRLVAATTLNTSGLVWPEALIDHGQTNTLTSPFNVSGTLTVGTGGNTTTFNGSAVNVQGALVIGVANGTILGTTIFNVVGPCTLSQPLLTSGSFRNPLNLNAPGSTITFVDTFAYMGGTLTYVAGTVVTTGSTLAVRGTSTLACAGMIWANFLFHSGGGTLTLTEPLDVVHCTIGDATNTNSHTINGYQINIRGNLSFQHFNATHTGTTKLYLIGTGSITQVTTSGVARYDIEINTAGTITIPGLLVWDSKTFTYTAGKVNSAGGVINWQGSSTVTINAPGVTLPTFLGTATSTTLTLTVNGAYGCRFEGVVGNGGGAHTLLLQSGNTYDVSGTLILIGTQTTKHQLRASTPSTPAYLRHWGAEAQLLNCTITDIDASGGKPLSALNGTLTRCTNINYQSEMRHARPLNPHILPTNWRS